MAKPKKTEEAKDKEESDEILETTKEPEKSAKAEEPEEKKVKKTRAKKETPEDSKEKKTAKEETAEEETQEEEGEFKLYTIPLREAFNVPKSRRASKAISVVKAFLKQHTKSDVKLSAPVNEAIWARGIKKPPRRIRVKVTKKEVKGELIKIAKLSE